MGAVAGAGEVAGGRVGEVRSGGPPRLGAAAAAADAFATEAA